MELKLRKGIVITVSYQGKTLWKFDDTFIFTDTLHGSQIYDGKGKKQYFLKDSERYNFMSFSEEYMDI